MKLTDDQNRLKPSIALFLLLWLPPVLMTGLVRLWIRSAIKHSFGAAKVSSASSNEMISIFVGTFALAWGLTLLASFWALKRRNSDVPNILLFENKGLE